MKKILVLNPYYLPGYKGGGPIKSIKNLVESLSDEFEFYILTSDRDCKSDKAYENIEFNKWLTKENYKIYYMTSDKQSLKGFNEIINNLDYDIMYLNGYFSPKYTIKPLLLRKLGKLRDKPIIISARGDFSIGHLNIKKIKKYTYIYLSKLIGLYKDLYWQATSDLEEEDIKNIFKESRILKAPNLSMKPIEKEIYNLDKKTLDTKIVFLSRICRKKNLLFSLEILKELNIDGEIIFDIYGPIEDKEYWKKCENIINQLPPNIKANYKGEVLPLNINSVLSKYHMFLFPTFGENYGHVIAEAFCAGCISVISDQTPWRKLEELNLGYDLNLRDMDQYKEAIYNIHKLNNFEYQVMKTNIKNYYSEKFNNIEHIEANKKLFNLEDR